MSRETHVQFCESPRVRFPGATHPRVQRLRRRTDSIGRVLGGRVAGYSLACDCVSQRLQNDRPREHQPGDFDTCGRDWKESRTPLRLCREPAGPGGRSGKHALSQLQNSVDRTLWLSDSWLPSGAERVLPIMRQKHPREMGVRVSGSDHRAPLCAAHAHPIRFACAELVTSHAISWLAESRSRSSPDGAAIEVLRGGAIQRTASLSRVGGLRR
jgi:hypothetical protein